MATTRAATPAGAAAPPSWIGGDDRDDQGDADGELNIQGYSK